MFKLGNRKFWTITSKNSADYWNRKDNLSSHSYIEDARRLWTPYASDLLFDEMLDRNLCISAETMSTFDQVHGARVLKESIMITAIGEGTNNSNSNYKKN